MTPEFVRVPCGCCKGDGFLYLTGEYLVTLMALREWGGERSGADMARRMGVKPTAMNNRLAGMERFGLVTSRRWGRKRLFTAKGATQ